MDNFVTRYRCPQTGRLRLPVAVLVCNQSPPGSWLHSASCFHHTLPLVAATGRGSGLFRLNRVLTA
jgi:hypothetical protein